MSAISPEDISAGPAVEKPFYKQEWFKKSVIISMVLTLAGLVYFILPMIVPSEITYMDKGEEKTFVFNELHFRTIAIFVIAAGFWATEVIPLFATSLLVIILQIMMLASSGGLNEITSVTETVNGVEVTQKVWDSVLPTFGHNAPTAETGKIGYKELLKDFASPLIMLFMGGFLLSSALTKHGMDRKVASVILAPFNRSPILLLFGVLGISAFFSMWMSNTATAAMMLAIMAPILKNVDPEDAFHRALILAVPFGANIGGIGTPIGTPPNAVAYENINNMLPEGQSIGFLDWMMLAVPLEIILLIGTGTLLYFFFKPKKGMKLAKIEKTEAKISLKGWITLAVLLVGVFLWLTAKPLFIGDFQIPLTGNGISSGVVALVMAMALTVIGLIDRRDVDSIDWNILILMWGGLAMGTALKVTGTAGAIKTIPFDALDGLVPFISGEVMIAIAVALLAVVMSTFMSNTATANLLVPLTLALSLAGGDSTVIMMGVLAGLACSFAMALPVSTPPNAMAYATGKIPVTSMLRAGVVVSGVSIVLMLVGYQLMIPLTLKLQQRVRGNAPEAAPATDPAKAGEVAKPKAQLQLEQRDTNYADLRLNTPKAATAAQ